MFDSVMPGLVPGIRVFLPSSKKQDVDGRDKPGHDDREACDQ
jgi:citronellyl-CoA dehydrogenase